MTQFPVRSSDELQRACDVVQPGDVILVHGGYYRTPSKLSNRSGRIDLPIVIRAADRQWISGGRSPSPYWGGGNPATDAPRKPSEQDFAFLVIDECHHLVIEGLSIRDCWPSIIFIKDSSHLIVRDCTLRHATYAIFAKDRKTSHLLVEGNEWQQDDSPDHRLWARLDWAEAHGNEGSNGLYRYFNGGFLSAKNIRGKVVVRRNRIMDAYNGIRLKAPDEPPPSAAAMPTVNADVHIVDNEFIRIRDNPIEPEVCAFNWHVRHNRLLDCHSWFSFDGVDGGYWYFYGNTGGFESRQGPPGVFGHTMGRVLKLSYEKRPREDTPVSEVVPRHPWFVFNNSWHLRCPLIGGSSPVVPAAGEGPDFTAHLDFFNNAFTWCDVAQYGTGLCEWIELMRNFDMRRSADTRFDYDICDREDFFAYFREGRDGEAHGLRATRPIFADAASGDFGPAADSEALHSGWARQVALPPPGAGSSPLRLHNDGTLNRGAMQSYGMISVPALEAQTTALLRDIGVREAGA